MIKRIIIFTLIVIIFSFDFLRDYIFQNINFQIHFLDHTIKNSSSILNYTDTFMENRLFGISSSNLIQIKWLFSFLFFFIYCMLSIIILRVIYPLQKKETLFFTLILFSSILVFSSLSYIFYIYSSNQAQLSFYSLSLELSHYLHVSLI